MRDRQEREGRVAQAAIRRTAGWRIAVVVAAGLALAACGRKGALEPPPGANIEGQPKTLPAGVEPGKAAVPDRPFILDRLL
jgi:predicted small lipoprotein YifL